jgi:hypothetical protein
MAEAGARTALAPARRSAPGPRTDVGVPVRVITLLAPPLVLVALALALFPSGGSDDSYITYGAARVLARTGEIRSYNGEVLEQSSSLLHTVVLAAGARSTGLSVPLLGHVVAPVAGMVAVAATVALARQVRPASALLAGLLTATSAYLAFWTFGGLETTLATAALVVTTLGCARVAAGGASRAQWLLAGGGILATVLVRPETGLLLTAALGAAAVLAGGARPRSRSSAADPTGAGTTGATRRLVLLVAGAAAACAALALLRWAVFGSPFPNPVAAKSGGLGSSDGASYVATWWLSRFHLPLLVAAVAGAAVSLVRARTAAGALVCTMLGAVVGFVLLSGGDWMQGGRFLAPAAPFVAVLAAAAVTALPAPRWRRVAGATLLVVQLLAVVDLAATRSTATPLWAGSTFDVAPAVSERFAWYDLHNRVHRRNAALLVAAEPTFERLVGAGPPVTVSGVQAGFTLYHLFGEHGRGLRFVDRHNLVSDDFGRCDDLLEPSLRGLGRHITYDVWSRNVERCGVPMPDVVIEYGSIEDHPALVGRYTTVAQVQPATNRAVGRLPGVDVGTEQFVAVRDGLLPST